MRAPAAAAAGCETATTPFGVTASTGDDKRKRTSQRAKRFMEKWPGSAG